MLSDTKTYLAISRLSKNITHMNYPHNIMEAGMVLSSNTIHAIKNTTYILWSVLFIYKCIPDNFYVYMQHKLGCRDVQSSLFQNFQKLKTVFNSIMGKQIAVSVNYRILYSNKNQ